jgi:hypothetical protein
MPHEHPLTYVQALVGRLTALQSRLDRLDDLLPHREIGQEAVREFALIQKHLLDLIIRTRGSEREILGALERGFPDYMERSQALRDASDQAERMELEMEGCPHRCWLTTVVQVERGVQVTLFDRIPECLAKELHRRYPRNFQVTRHPVEPDPEGPERAPDLPGFRG